MTEIFVCEITFQNQDADNTLAEPEQKSKKENLPMYSRLIEQVSQPARQLAVVRYGYVTLNNNLELQDNMSALCCLNVYAFECLNKRQKTEMLELFEHPPRTC